MSAIHSKSSRPGLDLKDAWVTSWLPWLKARAHSLRSRLSPSDPVLLFHPDGSQSVWVGNAKLVNAATAKAPDFVAVEIPDDLLLRRSLALPKMSQVDIDKAVLLEVRSNSPFAAEDLAWGCLTQEVEGGQCRAEIVIASRRHISDFIQSRWPDLAPGAKRPEAWAVAGLPAPVVISGYGEQRRLRHEAVEKRVDLALLLVACALAALAAMTPTAQLRLRALEAADALDAVMKRVAPLVRKRDELTALNDRLRSLDTVVADRVDPASVMEYLTEALPDDTYLYRLDIQKAKITASGHTVDFTALLQKLSSDPRLKDVRSPSAVTRAPGATKEAFTVEFTMGAKQQPISPAPAVSGPGAAAAQATPAAAPASRPATASKPASSPFTVGGSTR
jgi:general secretion pathway protein L